MPQNPSTSKTDCRVLSQAELLEFRQKQAEESQATVKRGKRRAQDSPNIGESEGSRLSPSPLTALSGLGTLALDSAGPSAADMPANVPATLPQPPLPEHPTPPRPLASKKPSQPSGKSASKLPAAAPT